MTRNTAPRKSFTSSNWWTDFRSASQQVDYFEERYEIRKCNWHSQWCFDPASGKFVSLTDDDEQVVTHFVASVRYIRRLPYNNYDA